MHRCAFWMAENKDEMHVVLRGELDGLKAFEQIHDQVSSAEGLRRLVIDLSETSQVRPIELHYLLADLSADPCFGDIEICVSGLRFTHMSTDCPYSHKTNQNPQAGHGSFERIRI